MVNTFRHSVKYTDIGKPARSCIQTFTRDFPTFSKQGPGTNDFGKNNVYISQIGKMDTKQNKG